MSKLFSFPLIGKLWRYAKSDQTKLFVKELNRSDIMEQSTNWNSFEVSVMIYSFNRLDLGNQQTWDRLQKLYIAKDRDMRLKDHVMCGWAFIKKEINQDFKEKLTGNIMRDWLNIKNSQQEQSNLGLISYIFSQNNVQDSDVWNKLSWIISDTLEYQDEKNFTLIIYSFSRQNYQDEQFWKNIERQLWNLDFDSFSQKHKMMIIFSFAKINQGSIQFWKKIELYVQQQEIMNQQDINFACWALGKANVKNHELWKKLISKIDPNNANLLDYDVVVWSISQVFTGQKDEKDMQIWKMFLSLDYPKRYSERALTEFQCILYIAGQLIQHDFTDNNLFHQVADRFKGMVMNNPKEFVSLKKRLYILKDFIVINPSIYNDHFHNLILQKIKMENQNFGLQYICDGVILCESLSDIKYSLSYIDQLQKIGNSAKQQQLKIYITTLIKLVERILIIEHNQPEYLKLLISYIEKDYIYDYLVEKNFVCHYALKVFLFQKDGEFYNNFLIYLKVLYNNKKHFPKPLFIRFLLTCLHRHNCYLPATFTQQFLADATYLYQLNCEDLTNKEGLESFCYLIDSIISLLKAEPMSYDQLKQNFQEYFKSYLDFDTYVKEAKENPDDEILMTLDEQTKTRQSKHKNRNEEYEQKTSMVGYDFIEKSLTHKIEKFFIR